MASEDSSPLPLLDDWIDEVGEDEVEKIIRAGLAEIENGTATTWQFSAEGRLQLDEELFG